MGTLKKLAATILDGANWLLLAAATGCTVAAATAKDGAERLRRRTGPSP